MTTIVIASVALAAAAVASVDPPMGAAGSPASHPMTFVDQRTGLSMSVQLDPAATDAGHLTFRVPDRGTYGVELRKAMRVLTPTSVRIDYSGTGVLRSSGHAPIAVLVDIQAHLDPRHQTGEATLAQEGERFHLVARPVTTAGLLPVAAGVEKAIIADDPNALYPFMNASLQRAYDAPAFVATWKTRASELGRVTALRRVTVGSVQTTDQGHAYVAVGYRADVVRPSGATIASFTAYFLREPAGWRLWTTVESP